MEFDNVSEEIAVEGDIRRGFKKTKCPSLAPVIDGENLSWSEDRPVIIGRLYKGKRKITVTYGNRSVAEAKLEELTTIAAGLPPGEAGLQVTGSSDRMVVLLDREPIPLAFAPAFILKRVQFSSGGGGYRYGYSRRQTAARYEWVPYNPAKTPSHKAALDDLGEDVIQGWKWRQ